MLKAPSITPEPELEPHGTHQFPLNTPALEILAGLWNRFYDWEYRESLYFLEGLQCIDVDAPFGTWTADSDDEPEDLTNTDISSDGSEPFKFIEWDAEGAPRASISSTIVENGPVDKRRVKDWRPNPRYTTCTPINANIYNVTSEHDVSVATYPLFADDPAFDVDRYLSLHERFAWQCDFGDPDRRSTHLAINQPNPDRQISN